MKNSVSEWKKLKAYHNKTVYKKTKRFDIVRYSIKSEKKITPQKIVFFSDLHIQNENFFQDELISSINMLEPDWIIYGGDLLSFLFYQKYAKSFLAKLRAKSHKLAVLGNWEKRRLKWIPIQKYHLFFNDANFTLLLNSVHIENNISFTGLIPQLDGYRIANDNISANFQCLISHSPDDVIAFLNNHSNIDLILCGHTHGGQIRIPGLGALITHSQYWKKFEYGQFLNKNTKSNMIVSSGLGFSGMKKRLFCNPEITFISIE